MKWALKSYCRSITLVAILILGPACARAQYPTDKTDQTAGMAGLLTAHLDQARKIDGTFLAAQASKEAAWHSLQINSAALGLKVTATVNSFHAERTEESRLVSGSVSSNRHLNSSLATITARQPLYRKKDFLAVEQATMQLQSAEAMAESATHVLFGRVFIAWVEILTARDLLHIARQAAERSGMVRDEMERRYRAGDISLDQLGVEISRQEQRQADVLDAMGRLYIAERGLIDLVGPEASVPSEFTLETATPNIPANLSVSEISRLVDERNPELRASRLLEEVARLDRERMRADRLPTVDLYASVSKGENDTISYIRDESRIGVQLSVPVYTSGSIDAASAQAEAQYRKAQAQTSSLGVRLRAQAISAASKLRTSVVRIDTYRTQVEATALRAEAVRRGFLAGTSTRGDFARAETEYLTARQRRANEMLEFANAWTSFVIAAAQIDASFLQERQAPDKQPVKMVGSMK